MATLFTSLSSDAESTALIIPSPNSPITLSHRELSQQALKFQQRLAKIGVFSKHTIALALPNSIELAVAFLATTFQRASAAPLNTAYKQEEFEFCLQGPNVPLILLPKGALLENGEAVRAAIKCGTAMGEVYWDGSEVNLAIMNFGKTKKRSGVEVEKKPLESDVAVVLHTRDTTGQLKAVPLTHQRLCQIMSHESESYRLSSADRTLLIMPLYHIHGLVAGFLTPLSAHSSVILPQRFSAQEFWHDFNTHNANWYTAIPPMHQALLRCLPSPVPKLRFVRSFSSPLPNNVLIRMEMLLNAPVLEGNAMNDMVYETVSTPVSPSIKPGSVGRAGGLEMQILDENDEPLPRGQAGQVCVLGASIAPGYTAISSIPSFTKTGYFRTGDRGHLDKDGFLFLTSTNKRLSIASETLVPNEKTYAIQLSAVEDGVAEEGGMEIEKSEKRYSDDDFEMLETEQDIKLMKRRRFSSVTRLLTSCFR